MLCNAKWLGGGNTDQCRFQITKVHAPMLLALRGGDALHGPNMFVTGIQFYGMVTDGLYAFTRVHTGSIESLVLGPTLLVV